MHILTDCPEEVGGWLPDSPAWNRRARGDLSADHASLWSALEGPEELHVADPSPPHASKAPPLLAVLAEAPRSQFDQVFEALEARQPVPHGTVALAIAGRDFHGQRGRPWTAMAGNIHLTAAYRVDRPAAHLGMGLSMLPAVAVIEAVREAYGGRVDAGIKWVNDILVDGCKIAGVITSTLTQAGQVQHVIFGIGVNVAHTPRIEADAFVPAASSLAEFAGEEESRTATFLWPLLGALDRLFHGLLDEGCARILQAYRSDSLVLGRKVSIWPETGMDVQQQGRKPIAAGTVEDIGEDLSLLLRESPDPVTRGRLVFED